MGDAADDLNDRFFDEHDEDDYWEDKGYYEGPVSCKYCYKYPLTWMITKNGWRLHTEAGNIHSCVAYRKALHELALEREKLWNQERSIIDHSGKG